MDLISAGQEIIKEQEYEKTISNNVLTPNGWVRVNRLVVRVFGKEITLRTTVEKIIIPDNAIELEKKAFKECLHDTEEMRKMIEVEGEDEVA